MTDRPTREELLEMFGYDSETGILWRRKDFGDARPAGSVVGTVDENGYRTVVIRRRQYKAHHLIWMMMTGEWPTRIDHKETDGPKADWGNRWSNLRLASNLENSRNNKVSRNNRSGYTGVFWSSQAQKWQAGIGVNRKQIFLGYFDHIETAAAARRAAEIEHFGEFAPIVGETPSPVVLAEARPVRTNCKHGHLLSEDNSYWLRGVRKCRVCGRLNNRRFRQRQRA